MIVALWLNMWTAQTHPSIHKHMNSIRYYDFCRCCSSCCHCCWWFSIFSFANCFHMQNIGIALIPPYQIRQWSAKFCWYLYNKYINPSIWYIIHSRCIYQSLRQDLKLPTAHFVPFPFFCLCENNCTQKWLKCKPKFMKESIGMR